MLNDGWDYLSDNTFLVHQNQTYDFRTQIVYHDHHTLAFPAIFQKANLPHRTQRQIDWRARLRALSISYLSHYLLESGPMHRLINPYRACQPQQLFPDLVTFRAAEPQVYALLLRSSKLKFEPIREETALQQLALINQISWNKFDEINRLTEINKGGALCDIKDTLQANLTGKDFFCFTLP